MTEAHLPPMATRSQRLVHAVVDTMIVASVLGPSRWLSLWLEASPTLGGGLLERWAPLLCMATALNYFFWTEFLTGRTVGKLLTGTKVVDEHGNPPSWRKVAGRTLLRLVPLEWISFLSGRPGFHDWESGTLVVQTRRRDAAA